MHNISAIDCPLRLERIFDIETDDIKFDRTGIDLSTIDDLRYIYGDEVPHDWLTESTGASYPQLIALAHAVLVREEIAHRVRVIVLAIATPDSQHKLLLGGYTTHLFSSRPNTFAVVEQGAAGPFTALTLAGLHLPGEEVTDDTKDDCALVLVLEQQTLPPADVPRPSADRIVALVVGRGSVGRAVEEVLIERLSRDTPVAAVTHDRHVSVAGIEVDALDIPDTEMLRGADPGVSTTVWSMLARALERTEAGTQPIRVTEVDRYLGYRCELHLSAQPLTDQGALVTVTQVAA